MNTCDRKDKNVTKQYAEGREEQRITKNKIPLYSLKSPGLHGFCLCLYARAGVLYEDEKENGISHFVEHIVFCNINYIYEGKLYDLLDSAGLTFTAATYKEFMQFCITGKSSRFSLAADILTKLFEPLSETLSGEEFESERGRIRAEIRECDEKSSLEYVVKKEVWDKTPLARMITGTLGSVSRITPKKCEEARKRLFSCDNAFFYATGNFSDADLDLLAQKVESYTLFPAISRENKTPLPASFGNRRSPILLRDSAYYMVLLCFDMEGTPEEKPIRSLFYDVMFAGENCRFFGELSEKLGYIYSYDAKLEEYGNAANLSVSYEVSLKDLYDSLSAAVRLLNEMKKEVGTAALANAKIYYTDNACLLLDNAEELNWTMAYENHILGGGSTSLSERSARYEAVGEEDVRRMAQKTFCRRSRMIGIKGRKKKLDLDRIETILAELDS